MTAVGAPNLTDDVWLYGGDAATLKETVAKGRDGQMPAFGERLGDRAGDACSRPTRCTCRSPVT